MRKTLFLLFLLKLSLCGSVYRPSFLSDDEIAHVRFERDDNSAPCNEDDLMNFLAEIQVINPESVVKLATLSDIKPSCNRVAENLEKIKAYLKTCTPPNQPDLYLQLIKGVEALHEKICTESPFKTQFEKIHKCLHELRNDLEDCGGPADWNENSDNAAVCKAYKAIADCYYIKTAKVCGNSAASTTRELLQAIIDSILTIKCDNVKETPKVKDPMPEEYIKKENKADMILPTVLNLVIMTITLIFI
ncbi:uncharacterized protein LOC123015751 [Tribolium madens]|uniref:uncharacterized protein LOC123015751 n=1 Tax=Tribolium madens TaxID=41895 RepID=UPI001CF72282|nr:uncharacterized protein LOC123015751 [Tribolium madens]